FIISGILTFLLVGLCSCSKSDNTKPSSASSGSSSSETASLPSEQVAQIVSAADKGESEKIQTLLKANPKLIHAASDDGWPLIMVAASKGHRMSVDALIRAGADV